MMYLVQVIVNWERDEQCGCDVEEEFVFDGPVELVERLKAQFECEIYTENGFGCLRSIHYEEYTPPKIRTTFPNSLNRKNRTSWIYNGDGFYIQADK